MIIYVTCQTHSECSISNSFIITVIIIITNKDSPKHTSLANRWPGCPLTPHLGPNFSECVNQNIGHMHSIFAWLSSMCKPL